MNPLFRKQWVQGIISWQGVDRAQKHQFPRERKGSVTSESGTSQKEQTVSQTYQVPFPPQGLCTCYSHCAELCFLCPVLLTLQSLAKWMPSPTPLSHSQVMLVPFYYIHSRYAIPSFRLFLLVWNYEPIYESV